MTATSSDGHELEQFFQVSFLRGQTRGSAFEENICFRCYIISGTHLHCRVC